MRYWMGGECENNLSSNLLRSMLSEARINLVSLPEYNEFEVALINALSLKTTECNANLYNEELLCQFKFHNISDFEQSFSQEWLTFQIGEYEFWAFIAMLPDFLFVDNENLRSLVNSKSNTIKTLAYEILLGPLLQKLEGLTGENISIKKINKKKPRVNLPALLSFSLSNSESDCLESILFFGEEISSQVHSLVEGFPGKSVDYINDLSVPARLEFGSTNLVLSDIELLEKGDVIFVDQLLSTNLSVFRALIDSCIIIVVRIEGSNFMVEEVITDDNSEHVDSGLEDLDSNNEDNPSNSKGDIINNLQINITFELGSISVALDELKRLQPGSIIPMNRPIGKAVNIYNNGRILGVGELVDIDNKLGVRIVGLSGS